MHRLADNLSRSSTRVTIALFAVERAVFIKQSKVVADRPLTQAQVLRGLPDGHRLSFAVGLSVEPVALADMRCSADTRLCTGHHEDMDWAIATA